MRRILFLTLVLVLIAGGTAGLVSCGSSGSSTTQALVTTPATGQTTPLTGTGPVLTQVIMQNFAFVPNSITVPTGTQITWVNNDSTTHTVTSDTGAFDSQSIEPQGTFSFTFNTAGTFSYHCSIHPTMTGTVIVQ
jgi:plastocyanin